jgi:hypothetical protein
MFDDAFDHLWDTYYAPHLTGFETNQFRRASRAPVSRLLSDFIQPQTNQPLRNSYLCISDRPDLNGRGPDFSRTLPVDVTAQDWRNYAYFTNALKFPTYPDPLKPKERVDVAPFYVMTFEYDDDDLSFFKQELGWFRSGGNKHDAPIGKFAKALHAQFADFKGLNVTYSGNKSFHYHLVFSTHLLSANVPTPSNPRHGFEQAWRVMAAIMTSSGDLSIPAGFKADESVRMPDHLRRLPHGLRLIDKPNQMFGVPAGEIVPQLVMWEHIFDRANTGAKASAFDPAPFMTAAPKATSNSSAALAPLVQGSSLTTYLEDRMRDYFPPGGWPEFLGFFYQRGEHRARFKNDASDRRATSYMGPGFHTVYIQGKNPLGLTTSGPGRMPCLPKPLGEMLLIWTADYHALNAPPVNPLALPLADGRVRSALELQFATDATDTTIAQTAIAKVLDKLILTDIGSTASHFLSAPEGISKSRSLIASTAHYVANLSAANAPELVMYAFATYTMAEEKVREFNKEYSGAPRWNRRFKGVVVPSFSHLYDLQCKAHGIKPYRAEDAARQGYKSLLAMVEALQPVVIAGFRSHYAKLWKKIGKACPVIFTVHQVAHDWVKHTNSRLMFAPNYWNYSATETSAERQVRRADARKATRLGLLIHDEVSAESLVEAVPAALGDWIETMKADQPSAWRDTATLSDRLDAFESFKTLSPPPEPISFDRAAKLVAIGKWVTVTTAYSGEYGEARPDWIDKDGNPRSDIYAATAGKPWRIHVRDWSGNAAHRTIVLTTEAVPTAIVRKIGSPWTVTELDTPLIPKDVVETVPSSAVTALALAKLVKEEQDAFRKLHGRELLAISNKVATISNTATHAKAKGSNEYMGEAVVQTMTMMAAEQYEFYEALNAWTGRTDLVRMRHIDEYNQTAGRNLGFRRRDGASHKLLINARLFDCLNGEPRARARYTMQETVTAHKAKAAKAQAKAASMAPKLAILANYKPQNMAALRAALTPNFNSQGAL